MDENADAYSGDTISMDGLEDQFPREEVRQSPPYITQSIVQAQQPVHRPMPLPPRRPAAAAGAAPRRQPELILSYPPELNFVPTSSRRRPREESPHPTQGPSRPKKARREPWPPATAETASRPNRSVYDNYSFINPNPADPRTVHDSDRRQGNQVQPRRGVPPVLIPTHGDSPDHELYDYSGSDSPAESIRRPAMSSSFVSDDGSSVAYSEQPSRADSRASSFASSVSSRAPVAGNHPPTRFGGVTPVPTRAPAPTRELQVPDIPSVVYGPVPYDCPLDIVELPTTEPLDAVTTAVRPKLKTVMDSIYLNPLPKEKLAELYKSYPRPANIEVLHKTRLNDDVRRALVARARETVVARDEQLRSLQWSLQFAARPILEVLDHVSDGSDTVDAKLIVRKTVDALKLIAKASWKQNDARRYNVYAGLKGTGLEVAQEHQNHKNFEFLLGPNPREQIVARQKEDEVLREMVATPRTGGNNSKPKQGNSRGGQPRGRHNNQGGRHQQSRGRQRSAQGDRSRQGNSHTQQNGSSHRQNSSGGGARRQRGRGQSNSNRGQNAAK